MAEGQSNPGPTKLDGDLTVLIERIDLPPPAKAALGDAVLVADALQRLVAGGFLVEAARLVAHALPKREATWWACQCAAHTAPPDAVAELAAREAAEQWVRRQTEPLRYEAMEKAQAIGFTTPGAWAAVAAFWSGPSMSPPTQPAVPPAPHLTGVAVAGAVILASVRGDLPERQMPRLRHYLDSARDIANGGAGRMTPESDGNVGT